MLRPAAPRGVPKYTPFPQPHRLSFFTQDNEDEMQSVQRSDTAGTTCRQEAPHGQLL